MVKIITGTVKDYGSLADTYFQIFYTKQKYLTEPKHLNMLGEDEYDNTFTISAQYPETEICKGDSVVFFFWEGAEDKSLITKLTCMEYDVGMETVINQDIYMLDFSKAFTMKLSIAPGDTIETEVGTPFDFAPVIDIEEHYNYLYKDGSVYFQDTSRYEFFNVGDWIENILYLDGEEVEESEIVGKIGVYNLTGLIKVFQFEFTIDFIYEVVEKMPEYLVAYEPIAPAIETPVTFDIKTLYKPEQVKEINFYYDDTRLITYPNAVTTEIPQDFSIPNLTPPARPFGTLKIETIYFNGVKDTTIENEYQVFYVNKAPVTKIANKDEIANSNFSTRNFNVFLDSRSAKTMYVKWSLKIDQNPDWIYLFMKEVFSFDDYTAFSDLKVLPIEILEVTGRLRAEIVVEDSFGDVGSDYVEFDNCCSKYEASNVSLLHSTAF